MNACICDLYRPVEPFGTSRCQRIYYYYYVWCCLFYYSFYNFEELARQLKCVLPEIDKEEKSVLVVGLGNRDVTADSLGPCTVDNLFITRHIIREYGKQAYRASKMHQISALVPMPSLSESETAAYQIPLLYTVLSCKKYFL